MTTPSTTTLPRGIYRIVVGGGGTELKRLTQGTPVTIAPPIDGIRQEVIHYFHDELEYLSLTSPFNQWQIDFEEDGTIIILPVTPVLQVPYLSYRGAPEKPKAGEQIVLKGTIRSPNPPPNKWRLRHTSLSTAMLVQRSILSRQILSS